MATTSATITLASDDILSNSINLSAEAVLTTAGTATGLTKTSGFGRTTLTSLNTHTLYRADDATVDGSNKVYLKNLSTDATEFFKVYIDQEQMGRLYAGDWAFFPWSATNGTKESFVVTIAGSWAINDRWTFDGVTTTAANTTAGDIAAQIHAGLYPNWTTAIAGDAVTFTAKRSMDAGTVVTATADGAIISAEGTANITSSNLGTSSTSDIIIVPSVATEMSMEHILFKE